MKKLVILIGLAVLLAGCQGVFEKDESGSSPALETVGKLRDANVASVPVNPYAHWVEIGLGLATVILGGSYVKKSKELDITGKKYAAVKVVIADEMSNLPAKDAAVMYEKIGQERKKQGL